MAIEAVELLIELFFRYFLFTQEKELGFVRRIGGIERRVQLLLGTHWSHKPWSDYDHKIRLPLLERCRAEKGADNRYISQPWHLIGSLLIDALEETCYRKALSIA